MQDAWEHPLERSAKDNNSYIKFVEDISAFAPPQEYKKVIILGACYIEIKLFSDYGYEAVGIGLQQKTRTDVPYYRMDYHDLKFPAESFDLAVYHNSFEHGLSPWLMVAEVRRILRLGGLCYLDMPRWDDEVHGIDAEGDYTGMNVHHSMFLHPNQIRHVFRDLGFEHKTTEPYLHDKIRFVFKKLKTDKCAFKLIKPMQVYEQIDETIEEIKMEEV